MPAGEYGLPHFRFGASWSQQSAEELNNLVEAVRSGLNIRGVQGSGITVTKGPHGVNIGMSQQDIPQQAVFNETWVVLRNIPNPDQYVLEVERAVWHSDFTGAEDVENLHRFVPASEFGNTPGEPKIERMAVWPHWKAGDFELFVWPVSDPRASDRSMDILTAELRTDAKGKRGWFVRPDVRMYLQRMQASAPVGSCAPFEQLEDL